MPLNIRGEAINRLAQTLAVRIGTSKTDAAGRALKAELQRLDGALPLRERLRPVQDRVLSHPPTGNEAGKAFFDDLSGDPGMFDQTNS